ncbi:MAG TPA: NAD(P)H-quinone oxidoreductase [Candidatus Tyrphobacter sp.]
MRYVSFDAPGGLEMLHVARGESPKPAMGEVLIAVEAAGVSRADVLQRRGLYPPPPGASTVLGLDVAGTVAELGGGVTDWQVGDRVCALLGGGGYAEFATAPQGQVLPIPEGWSAVEAATLPENAFTVFDNMVTRGRLGSGELVLVHGGTSGIGSTAIMFAVALGARAIATAGSEEKCDACRRIGALDAIDYKTKDFVEETLRITQGRGVDLVIDIVGGEYGPRNVRVLAPDGRIACIATQGGSSAQIDLGELMRRRGTIFGSSLRPRTAEQKKAIADALRERIWPLLPARDPIAPLVDSVFDFAHAADAHRRMEASAHIGKIVLTPG